MLLKQAAQAPLIIDVEFDDGKKLKLNIPHFTIGNFIAWGSVVDQEHIDKITKGMKPDQRFQLLNFYGPMPSNLYKLKGMVGTPHGTNYVCRKQLTKAKVIQEDEVDLNPARKLSDEEVEKVMSFEPTNLRDLAIELTDIPDEAGSKNNDKGPQGDEDPLAKKSNTESQASAEIGDSTSQSSTPDIQVKTLEDSPSDDS